MTEECANDGEALVPSPKPNVQKPKSQMLNEFCMRHKSRRTVEWEQQPGTSSTSGEWACTLRLCGGSVGDRRLPDLSFYSVAAKKKDAEREACEQAWAELARLGFLHADALAPRAKATAPAWQVPTRRCSSNPVVWADVSADGRVLGRVVMEFYVDVLPLAAGTFAAFFAPGVLGAQPGNAGCLASGANSASVAACAAAVVGVRFVQLSATGLLLLGAPPASAALPADDDTKSELVHSRPFLLTQHPDSVASWELGITMSRLPRLDATHRVVGQVLAGFGVLRELGALGEAAADGVAGAAHASLDSAGVLPAGAPLGDVGAVPLPGLLGLPAWPDDLPDPSPGEDEAAARLRDGEALRADGNAAYQAWRYSEAVERYTQALRYVDWTSVRRPCDLLHSMQMQLCECHTRTLLNRSAAACRAGRHADAAADARTVLAARPDHAKAHFRLGAALMAGRQLDGAVDALARAQQLCDGDAAVAAALRHARRQLREQRAAAQKAYARLFASGALSTAHAEVGGEDACGSVAGRDMPDGCADVESEPSEGEGAPGVSPEVEHALHAFAAEAAQRIKA